MHFDDIQDRSPAPFKRLTGVRRETFDEMLCVLRQNRRDFGRPPKLPCADQLLLTLMYYREYRTQLHIAQAYGDSEPHGPYGGNGAAGLPEVPPARQEGAGAARRSLRHGRRGRHRVAGGAAPKKQRRCYSGKKKRHTHKAQVVVDTKSKKIIATAFAPGRVPDFALFKQSDTRLLPGIRGLGDSGFPGIAALPPNSQTPHKRSKHRPLLPAEKAAHRERSRERIVGEHVIRSLKVLRLLAGPYRNRRTRFGLRFNLIAAIDNRERDRQQK